MAGAAGSADQESMTSPTLSSSMLSKVTGDGLDLACSTSSRGLDKGSSLLDIGLTSNAPYTQEPYGLTVYKKTVYEKKTAYKRGPYKCAKRQAIQRQAILTGQLRPKSTKALKVKLKLVQKAPNAFPLFVKEFKKSFLGDGANLFKQAAKEWKHMDYHVKKEYTAEATHIFTQQQQELKDTFIPVKKERTKSPKVLAEDSNKTQSEREVCDGQPHPAKCACQICLDIPAEIRGESRHPWTVSIGGFTLCFRRKDLLGSGATGQVYLATHDKLLVKAAAKVFQEPEEYETEKAMYTVILKTYSAKASHQMLKRLFLALYAASTFAHHSILFLELLPTSLAFYLHKQKKVKSQKSEVEKLTRVISSQTQAALQVIHNAGFVHCDVKPANILWVEREERAVLIDFSHCSKATPTRYPLKKVCTEGYRPPELLPGAVLSAIRPHADFWSLGCVLYDIKAKEQLFTRHPNMWPHTADHAVRSFCRWTEERFFTNQPNSTHQPANEKTYWNAKMTKAANQQEYIMKFCNKDVKKRLAFAKSRYPDAVLPSHDNNNAPFGDTG